MTPEDVSGDNCPHFPSGPQASERAHVGRQVQGEIKHRIKVAEVVDEGAAGESLSWIRTLFARGPVGFGGGRGLFAKYRVGFGGGRGLFA